MVGVLNDEDPPPELLSPLELVVGALNEDAALARREPADALVVGVLNDDDPPPELSPLDPLVVGVLNDDDPPPELLARRTSPLVRAPADPLEPAVAPAGLAATGMDGSASTNGLRCRQWRSEPNRSRSTRCPRPCK